MAEPNQKKTQTSRLYNKCVSECATKKKFNYETTAASNLCHTNKSLSLRYPLFCVFLQKYPMKKKAKEKKRKNIVNMCGRAIRRVFEIKIPYWENVCRPRVWLSVCHMKFAEISAWDYPSGFAQYAKYTMEESPDANANSNLYPMLIMYTHGTASTDFCHTFKNTRIRLSYLEGWTGVCSVRYATM